MEKQNEKAFTVTIVNNETHEEKIIHTNAIVAGIEENDGARAIVQTNGEFFDVCAACHMALNAAEYIFKNTPQIREAVTMVRAKQKKEKEGANNEQK